MEFTLESLIQKGLTAEQANAVLSLHKESLKGQYVPMQRFEEVNSSVGALRDTLKAQEEALTAAKNSGQSLAELQSQLDALKTESAKKAEEHAAELAKTQKSSIVRTSLTGKVHDVDLVLGMFDLDKFELKDGKLTGFEEQAKALKESKGFLFLAEEANPVGNPGSEKVLPEDIFKNLKISGAEPPAGDSNPTQTGNAETLGKMLAEQKLGAQKASIAAAEKYFNIGGK